LRGPARQFRLVYEAWHRLPHKPAVAALRHFARATSAATSLRVSWPSLALRLNRSLLHGRSTPSLIAPSTSATPVSRCFCQDLFFFFPRVTSQIDSIVATSFSYVIHCKCSAVQHSYFSLATGRKTFCPSTRCFSLSERAAPSLVRQALR
jgi:hypothetical protein